jgi:hypothetical protein
MAIGVYARPGQLEEKTMMQMDRELLWVFTDWSMFNLLAITRSGSIARGTRTA